MRSGSKLLHISRYSSFKSASSSVRCLHSGRTLYSGHNKWSKIRHSKGAADAERAKIFSRISNDIVVAVKLGGLDPHFNIRLAACLASAKKADMPKSNIETALNRGSGKGATTQTQNLMYEANIGPVGLIIDVLTDNKTRTIANIKSVVKKAGGAVSPAAFQFDHVGQIVISAPDQSFDQMEELAIEVGANDVSEVEGDYEFTTEPASLGDVANAIKSAGHELLQAELRYVAKEYPPLSPDVQKQAQDLVQLLEQDDDVVKVTSNVRIEDPA